MYEISEFTTHIRTYADHFVYIYKKKRRSTWIWICCTCNFVCECFFFILFTLLWVWVFFFFFFFEFSVLLCSFVALAKWAEDLIYFNTNIVCVCVCGFLFSILCVYATIHNTLYICAYNRNCRARAHNAQLLCLHKSAPDLYAHTMNTMIYITIYIRKYRTNEKKKTHEKNRRNKQQQQPNRKWNGEKYTHTDTNWLSK